MEELLTIGEVAKLLKVHTRTLRRWIAAGKIPAIDIGRGWRFERAAIETWLADRTVNTPPKGEA